MNSNDHNNRATEMYTIGMETTRCEPAYYEFMIDQTKKKLDSLQYMCMA